MSGTLRGAIPRAIDPPNPARGFIQQNENVRFATAACMQKYGNVSFATVACAKCMRYGGRGGDPYHGGWGGWQHGTRNHIYICLHCIIYIYIDTVLLEHRWGASATGQQLYTPTDLQLRQHSTQILSILGGPKIKHPQKYNSFRALIGSPRDG